MLSKVIDNKFCCKLDKEDMLREVIVKIGLKRIDTQKGVIVKILLDSDVTGLYYNLKILGVMEWFGHWQFFFSFI